MKRTLSLLPLLLALVGAPVSAAAAEPSAAEIAVARTLFRDAVALEKDKKWHEAEEKLRAAIAIKDTPGLRYHVAFCLEQQGKLVEALVEYDRADEMLQSGLKAPDVANLVGPARDALRDRLPTLIVRLPEGVTGATLEIDGKRISTGVAGQPLPVNPGRHVVTVTAPGRAAFTEEVTVAASERRDVVVTLAAAEPSAPVASASDSSPPEDGGVSVDSDGWSTRTWVLIGEGAFTGLALGLGIFGTLDKSRAQSEVDAARKEIDTLGTNSGPSACTNPEPEDVSACEQLPGLNDQVSSASTLQTLGFVGAGVGALATVATFVFWPAKDASEAARRPRLHAVPTPQGAFFGVGASF